ncbi:MAG: leader peptide processing enzyme [Sphaerochaetaceae bacterium]|jgi:amino acid transporter|nr:leader peptide processing enzyme [Sphaerochaetaceae bacterium]NLO61428.1 leader peptide processing enzyme [Spirochaetales bacterium]MDD2406297.1 leader peptide processing enzyme [Sphaerochaetaceae bacterium]MDD3669923.1 leader peptide processing enzyme [Sphaerochaetaceae bacterium]MDD4258558.1 leader peptide processing enzyme [Sphaerochaetaceae bacterium]
MNKKANTAIFILVATIFNIIIMLLLFTLFLYLLARFVDPESELMFMWIGLLFIVSIGGSFFIYTMMVKLIMKKFDLEKHLDPIFSKKKKGTRDRLD